MQARTKRILAAVAISAFVHVFLVLGSVMVVTRESKPAGPARYFDVTAVTAPADPRNPTEEQREQDEHYEPRDDLPDGQIVEAPEAGERRRPDDTRFLAQRDQVVEHQTHAHRWGRPARTEEQPTAPPTLPGGPSRRGALHDERPMPPAVERRGRGQETEQSGDGTGDQPPLPIAPGPLNLNPTYAALSDAVGGGGGTSDSLSDVDEGEKTLLTTARFLHAPFFQRVKDQVEQYWHPDVAFARHDPGGHVYGFRDRETVIQVVLDAQGGLERNYVLRASGADFLDEEALRAIEQAAPFPNPPRGLVDEQTQRIVFTFGFTVELGEQPIFRVRRYH